MFITLTAFVSNTVTKYKARRVATVIDTYFELVGKHVATLLPAVISTYHQVARVTVDKTYENPQVAIDLVNALHKAVDHYGPSVIEIIKAAQQQLEAVQPDCTPLNDAIEAMTSDIAEV